MKKTLINLCHKIARKFFRAAQKFLSTATVGVRAIVLNEQDQVLLVKHTYTLDWYLPGGGVDHGETPHAAIKRELMEEVGVEVLAALELFHIYFHTVTGAVDFPILYIVKKFRIQPVSCPEIKEFSWFGYQELPHDISPATKRRLDEYFLQKEKADHW